MLTLKMITRPCCSHLLLVISMWKLIFDVVPYFLELQNVSHTYVLTYCCHCEHDDMAHSIKMGHHHVIEMTVRPWCSLEC